MRTRFLTLLAVSAAFVVPAAAHAATISVESDPYVAPVELQWDATAAVMETLYRFAYTGPGSCDTPIPGTPILTDSTAPFDTLAFDTPPDDGTWCYYVEDDIAFSSNVVVADVDLTPPVAPAVPTGATPVASAPAITFSGSTDTDVNGVSSAVHHYDVYRDGVKVNSNTLSGAGPFSWSDVAGQSSSPASGSHTYAYTVVAVDGAGNTSDESPARAIVLDSADPVAPAAPTGATPVSSAPSISFGATSDQTVNGVNTGIDHYDVYRDGLKVNSNTMTGAGPFSWSDVVGQSSSPASGSHSYSYTVVAVDGVGNDSTSPAHVIVLDSSAPNTPGTPGGTTPISTTPVITFNATTDQTVNGVNTGINHYDVYRNGVKVNSNTLSGAGPFTWSDVAGQSSSPVTGSGSYSYRVLAVDGVGNSSAQSAARVIVVDADAPNAPATPGGTTPVSAAPAITFSASTDPVVGGVASGINHYDVYRNGVKVNSNTLSGAGPFSWSDVAGQSSAPVSGSGSYSYTVLAVDAAGNASAQSAARVIVLDADAPVAPAAPTGTTPVSAAPAIGFAASTDPVVGGVTSGIAHYDVYRDGVKVNSNTLSGAGPFSWSDVAGQSSTPASGSHNYSYTVVAVDAAGNISAQSPALVILLDTTAPSQPGTPTGFATVQSAPSFTFAASTDPLVPAGTGVASGLNHYDVSRDGGAPVAITATTFVDSSVLADGFHTYTVVAVDNAGNASTSSGAFIVFLDSAAASSPQSVAAAATPTNQRPQISWVAPTTPGFTIDHYDIFRVGTGPRVGVVDDAVTTFTDNSVSLPDNTYAYVVVAVSDTAFSGVASGAAGVVYDTLAPSAPANVAAGAALDGSVNLSWAASSDGSGSGVARYVVRRSSSSIPPATAADGDATCQTTATSCVDASALNGKLYSYAVFAIDAAGNASVAGISQPVTARDQAPPNAPQGLAAKPGNASVDLSWTPAAADSDVAGYVLVAKQGTLAPTSETDGLRVCTAIIGSSSSCSAGGLTNGATYTFGLFALDEALNRSQPAVVSAAPNGKVTDVKAPGAVTKLRVKVVGNKVTLTWKNPADRDFDHVVITSSTRKPSQRKASTRVYSGKGTKAATKLPAGQSRWFLVIAYDAVGNASAPASVRAIVAPVSPFGPAPHAKVKGKVRLSWPVVKRARYYNVQIYAGKKRIAVGWPAKHALVVPHAKLHKGVKYTWYVWPGLGAKAKAHYGKLIGKNVFTFAG